MSITPQAMRCHMFNSDTTQFACYCIRGNSSSSALCSPSLLFFSHSRNNHTPPFLAYSQCKSPAGSFVYNTAGKRKCHLGTPPLFLRHSLSSSHVVHAVLVSLESDEQNFTLARASYYLLLGKKPTHRARCCHRPVPYTSHRV